MSQTDSRTQKLEQHIAEGRKVVYDLISKLGGSPGIDPMEGS